MKNQRAEQAASAPRARNTFDEQVWRANDTAWWYAHAGMFLDPDNREERRRTRLYRLSKATRKQIGHEVSTIGPASPLKALWNWFKSRKKRKEPEESPLSNFYADVTDPHATQPMAITVPLPLAELAGSRR